jgi:cytochrome b561
MPAVLIKDTKTQYGLVSVAVHWLIAITIIILIPTGVWGHYLPLNQLKSNVLNFHLSLACAIAPFFLFRIYWRLKSGKPKAPKQTQLLDWTAGIVWRVLLLGPAFQLITGPILTWAHKHPIGIIGLIEMNSPYSPTLTRPQLGQIYAVADFFHILVGLTIATALGLHIAGALKHLIIDRDGVLQRMLRPGAEIHAPGAPAGIGKEIGLEGAPAAE